MRFWAYHFPAVLLACIILTLSSIPRLQPPELGVAFQDKIFHVIAYLALGIALCHSAYDLFDQSVSQILYTLIVGIPFAALDECHQALIPGRLSSVYDFLADTLGVLLAILFYYWFAKALIKRIIPFFY